MKKFETFQSNFTIAFLVVGALLLATSCMETELEYKPSVRPLGPLEPTFKSLNEHFFKPKCAGCHSEGGERSQTLLVSYDDFIEEDNDIIDLFEPKFSPILQRLKDDDPEKGMPPDKAEMKKLNEKEIEMIFEWIKLGAPKE